MASPSDPVNSDGSARPRRVSRQREAGEATRRETRRRILVAGTEVFAERGYAGATVARIAARADVAVQTLYSAWGSKRAILRAVMVTALTGAADGVDDGLDDGLDPNDYLDPPPPDPAADPHAFVAHVAHEFRVLAERAAVGWRTYRDAAGTDPDIAADWQALQEARRETFRFLVGLLPADALRPGLTAEDAADTAWVIASPETYELLVLRLGFDDDRFEDWVRTTLDAALLR